MKTNIGFTDRQLAALLDVIDTIESMYGVADIDEESGAYWDGDMRREIKFIDRALKKAGIDRN